MSKFLPIILGSDENAYGTARQLRATRDSSLFDVKVVPDLDRDDVFPDALIETIDSYDPGAYPDGFVVIPCSDYYTGLLCRHADRFKGKILNRFNPPELLETFDTKDRFYALCKKYGLDYPKTVVAEFDERERVMDHLPFDFPIVCKPENSNATDYLHCKFEGVKKVYFFSCKEEYLDIARKLTAAGYRGKLILQEFIPGGDDAMRVLNSYSDNSGKVRAMCLGQPVLEFYDPPSIGNYAAIVSRSDHALYRKMKAFLEEIGYVGFSNFDMKYDSRTGRYVLFEINPRLGRSSFFSYCAGMNFMQYLADDVIDGKHENCVYNENTVLWSHVPRGVLTRYVTNDALRREIRHLPMHYTLWWEGDRNAKRAYRLARYALGQYKSFRRWYFDKTGEIRQK